MHSARDELEKLSVADLLSLSEESAGNGQLNDPARDKCEFEI